MVVDAAFVGNGEVSLFLILAFHLPFFSKILDPKVFQYFRGKFHEILFVMGGSREIGVFPRFQSQFFDLLHLHCIKLKDLRIAGFLASTPFQTHLNNKRLKLSIHCVQS